MCKYDHAKGFTVLSNEALKDPKLSFKAKGLLACILSKPDGWAFAVERLQDESKDGLDSVKSGIKELEQHGYLIRVQKKDTRGRISGYDYHTNGGNHFDESSIGELSIGGFSTEEKPSDLINTDISNPDIVNTDLTNTEYIKEESNSLHSLSSSCPAVSNSPKKDVVPYQRIVDAYNSTCIALPRCTKLSESRKKHMSVCWRTHGEKMFEGFRMAQASDFLSGRSGNWRCSFDWLINANNMTKVLEGTYSRNSTAPARKILARDYTGQYANDVWEES